VSRFIVRHRNLVPSIQGYEREGWIDISSDGGRVILGSCNGLSSTRISACDTDTATAIALELLLTVSRIRVREEVE